MNEPRVYTDEEILNKVMAHIWSLIDYWDEVENRPSREKITGAVFSILSMLDGCSTELPGFLIAPRPHEDDKDYLVDQGENYFPENHEIENQLKGEIGKFMLHEQFYSFDPERNDS